MKSYGIAAIVCLLIASHTIAARFQAKTFIYKEAPPEDEMDSGAGGR